MSQPKDYKDTVFLPHTSFPMKAGLAGKEPSLLERWASQDLYGRLESRGDKETFILHDGPPYANGHIHTGSALNKILKDMVLRSQRMLGKRAPYVPGWDCHGLPIEWKIEEKYRKKGQEKESVSRSQFRQECREFAAHWLSIQREEFKRLGVLGRWETPYTTMDPAAEAKIMGEIIKFFLSGRLYRGAKPVLWSVVEKTALAEAEVEYYDKTSRSIYVAFPVVSSPCPSLEGAHMVIWTTTPWTLPANRAIAYGPQVTYHLLEGKSPHTAQVMKILVAADLQEAACQAMELSQVSLLSSLTGADLASTVCSHPLKGLGYEFSVPLLPGSHVTVEAGTGLVHTAPSHGLEDFEVGLAHGLEVPLTVADDGVYTSQAPGFTGTHIFKADPLVIQALKDAGFLLAESTLTHSYPHSWRSKAPLIYRATPQWFISMTTLGLRDQALEEIEKVRWVPAQGKNRIRSMVQSRPDWCISRQRAWGVPIPLFIHRETGEPLKDPQVYQRVIQAAETEGADVWFNSPASRFLGETHKAEDFEQVFDIVDVWFESGTTHAFVLEGSPSLGWPADLCLEGSDQHRGWFQTSLLEACGTRGKAPYKTVITHGFVVDGQGRKMSKSLGNVVAPEEIISKHGADVLRLWVAMSDYQDDLRIGEDIIKSQEDIYRRFRNTLRYLLGSLHGFTEAETLPYEQMPELEKWVLHRLSQLDQQGRQALETYNFHQFYAQLHTFCSSDLSAYYFDIRKDSLYCDSPTDVKRRGSRTVLKIVWEFLTRWLAPVLCFTAEESWLSYYGEDLSHSVHLQTFLPIPAQWHEEKLASKWEMIRQVRRVMTGALEQARANRTIGSSLQAQVTLFVSSSYLPHIGTVSLEEIGITSRVILQEKKGPEGAFSLEDVPGVSALVAVAEGVKCARCWHVLPQVAHSDHGICPRCEAAIQES
jgi:isoleucyl-tRNA synthetase